MATKNKKGIPLRTHKREAILDLVAKGVTNYRGKTVRAKGSCSTQAKALEVLLKAFNGALPRGPAPQVS